MDCINWLHLGKDCWLEICRNIREFKDWNYLRSTCRFFQSLLCFERAWLRWGKEIYFDYFPIPTSFLEWQENLMFERGLKKFDKMYVDALNVPTRCKKFLKSYSEQKLEASFTKGIDQTYQTCRDFLIHRQVDGFSFDNKKTGKEEFIATTLDPKDRWLCTNSYIFILSKDAGKLNRFRSRIHPFFGPALFNPIILSESSFMLENCIVDPQDENPTLIFFNELIWKSHGELSEQTFTKIPYRKRNGETIVYADREFIISEVHDKNLVLRLHNRDTVELEFPSRKLRAVKRISDQIVICTEARLSFKAWLDRFQIFKNAVINVKRLFEDNSSHIIDWTFLSHYFFFTLEPKLCRLDILTGETKQIDLPVDSLTITGIYHGIFTFKLVRTSLFIQKKVYHQISFHKSRKEGKQINVISKRKRLD